MESDKAEGLLPSIIKGRARTAQFRRRLLAWYGAAFRDLPWRNTRDPYAIWVSEIMLQQTRVQAVIPYYERFLQRFPSAGALAAAPEQSLLAAWAGLGYYSRARNMQKAAREVARRGKFPNTYAALLELPGIGPYTAAAVASIAFGLPRAVLDGNVARVLARITADPGEVKAAATRTRLGAVASALLDRRDPGGFNQALMELGATVCTPRNPKCQECPVSQHCRARALGRQHEFPIAAGRPIRTIEAKSVFVVERRGKMLLRKRPAGERRMPGFWELPENLGRVETRSIGGFRHSIVNHTYAFDVRLATVERAPDGLRWWPVASLHEIPLTTTSKKALACWERHRKVPSGS